jgi:hypothetical protein
MNLPLQTAGFPARSNVQKQEELTSWRAHPQFKGMLGCAVVAADRNVRAPERVGVGSWSQFMRFLPNCDSPMNLATECLGRTTGVVGRRSKDAGRNCGLLRSSGSVIRSS